MRWRVDGRAIRVLSVVDAYTRECLALEVDTSFASRRVTRVLEQIVNERGVPQAIRCDNGPELTSRHFLAWCIERQIELLHIQPGKPTQNARIESFHGRLREECLAVSWFQNLFDARRKIVAWRKEYNEERPHSSLGYKTPSEFAAQAASFYTAEREAVLKLSLLRMELFRFHRLPFLASSPKQYKCDEKNADYCPEESGRFPKAVIQRYCQRCQATTRNDHRPRQLTS